MQATVRRTNKNTGKRHHQRIGALNKHGNPGEKKSHPRAGMHRNDFLKYQFDVIPVKADNISEETKSRLSEKDYGYLLECAHHYAGLLGKTIEEPSGSLQERICILYHRFALILPAGQQLNMDRINGGLSWIIYYEHRWNDHKFYWMPVGFITRLSGEMKGIALSFMNRFIRRNGLTRFCDSYEFSFLVDCICESVSCNGFRKEEEARLEKLLASYFQGSIGKFMDEIHEHQPVDVDRALETYRPANPQEAKLVECFRKGLPFISGGSIMSYDYHPQSESESAGYMDEPPVSLDRIIRYVYELDDYVTNELEEYVNSELQQSCAMQPVSFSILHPKSAVFGPGDYPERFSEWFLEMVDMISDLEIEQVIENKQNPRQNESPDL